MTKPSAPLNRLYYGDNLDVLRRHVDDESVDLVYLDPPFNVGGEFSARPVPTAAHSTCGEGKAQKRHVAYRVSGID